MAVPSNVKAGKRVLATAPTVMSTDTTDGVTPLLHTTAVEDAHAAVAQTRPSTRPLGVVSRWAKLRPATETTATAVRALLSTPR